MIVSNFPGGSDVFALPLDGSKEMTGDLKLGGNQIKNIGAPEEETDAARKQEITDHNKSEDAHANILSDMVKATGGATMTMGETIGVGPYDIQITEDEDGEISASDVSYDNRASGMTATDVQAAVTELFTSVSNGKNLIAGAITDKGVSTSGDATFRQMADNIGSIETGTDTGDATASAGDILSGKTAYGASGKLTGTIPTVEQATPSISVSDSGLITASATQSAGYTAGGSKSATQQLETAGGAMITPSIRPKVVVSKGVFTTGNIGVAGDANLVPENIKSGVSIFGVDGTFEGGGETVTIGLCGWSMVPYIKDAMLGYINASGALVFEDALPLSGALQFKNYTVMKNTPFIIVGSTQGAGGSYISVMVFDSDNQPSGVLPAGNYIHQASDRGEYSTIAVLATENANYGLSGS